MNKKKVIYFSLWLLNLLILFILVWSLINYKILDQEVSRFVQEGGLLAMIFLIILLEGAPVFVGSGLVVASVLAMKITNPGLVFLLFIISAIIGNILYFFLGYFSGKKILKYFEKKDVKKYKELFQKYGWSAMIIMAVSPIPYLPTLAGVFGIDSPYRIAGILAIRMVRHTVVFLFWFFILVGF